MVGCLPFFGRRYAVPTIPEISRQNIYATHDSLKNARIDLATGYSELTIREIPPPKTRLSIPPIYKPPTKPGGPSQRVIIVPPEYGKIPVVVVGSEEYEELLKWPPIAQQLQKDNDLLKKAAQETGEELIKKQQLLENLGVLANSQKVELEKLDGDVFKRDVIIGVLFLLMGLYVYIKIKKIIPIPFGL